MKTNHLSKYSFTELQNMLRTLLAAIGKGSQIEKEKAQKAYDLLRVEIEKRK